jgi:hypothetical protein
MADYIVSQWGGRWDECADAYALRNVLPHLSDAAFDECMAGTPSDPGPAALMLRETLADPAYVTTALAAVGVDELRAALSYARYRIAGTAADVDTLPTLAEILHRQTRTLRECRSGPPVTRQLVYEAATLGATDLARGLALRGVPGDVETFWATDDYMLSRRLPGANSRTPARRHCACRGRERDAGDQRGVGWHHPRLATRLRPTENSLPTSGHVAAVHPAPDADQVRAAYSDGTAHE